MFLFGKVQSEDVDMTLEKELIAKQESTGVHNTNAIMFDGGIRPKKAAFNKLSSQIKLTLILNFFEEPAPNDSSDRMLVDDTHL